MINPSSIKSTKFNEDENKKKIHPLNLLNDKGDHFSTFTEDYKRKFGNTYDESKLNLLSNSEQNKTAFDFLKIANQRAESSNQIKNDIMTNLNKLAKRESSNHILLNNESLIDSDNDSSKSSESDYEKKSTLKKSNKETPKSQLLKSLTKNFKSYNEEKSFNEGDEELEELPSPRDHRRLEKIEKICDSDTEDEGSDTEKEVKWIILPENNYKRVWDIVIAVVIIYSSIVLPYKIAFSDEDSEADIVIDTIITILLSIDIVLNFFSAYVDNDDNVIKNRKKIIKTYLKTWFIIDFVSILPISYFFDSTDSTSSVKINTLARLGRIPKLYRLIRLSKLVRMAKILKRGNVNRITKFFLDKLKVNANIERLIYFILAFLLLNHISACIWYFMARLDDLSPDSWVMRLGYIDASDAEIYIVSFYWTLTTVTTVGYGDINAGTTLERIYNLFIMSFGVLMYSFAIGSLSSIVSTLDNKTADMNQKLQILSSIKKEFNLDQEIYDKVRKVIKYDLSRNQKDKMNFLQELPNKLRIELSQIMHDSVIQKMYFFNKQPSDFIAYVAPLLKPVKFSQNDFLYKTNDMMDEMYFVSKGTISFCLGKEYNEKEIKEIKKHNNFGEIEMCLNEKLGHNIKVKSRNCELFVLKKTDFLRLSVNFKDFIEKFLQRSLMIYLRFNDEKKKIMKIMDDQNKADNGDQDQDKSANDLEMIREREDEEVSEEYDIFGDHSDSPIIEEEEDERHEEQLESKPMESDIMERAKQNIANHIDQQQLKRNSIFSKLDKSSARQSFQFAHRQTDKRLSSASSEDGAFISGRLNRSENQKDFFKTPTDNKDEILCKMIDVIR